MQLTTARTRPGSDQITRIAFKDGVHSIRIALPEIRTHDTNRFRKELAALYEPGKPLLIAMSLKRVNILSSACMGMLVEFSDALAPVGCGLVLYDVPKDISKMLKKLGLHKQLPIAKSGDHARKLVRANMPVHPGGIRGSAA
ncbi:MAG: STAS domain-containing protein [Phycisphaerales bacterium]|nr:STAS domain-containing protein [Phycisphaerales bacterium]